MIVTYIERIPIDRFRVIDTVKSFYAISYFKQGELTYFKTDSFNYQVVATAFIKSIV